MIVSEMVLCILYRVMISVYKLCLGLFLVILFLLFLEIIFWNGLIDK